MRVRNQQRATVSIAVGGLGVTVSRIRIIITWHYPALPNPGVLLWVRRRSPVGHDRAAVRFSLI